MLSVNKRARYSKLIQRRSVLRLAVLGLFIYLVLAGISGLGSSWQATRNSEPLFLMGAVAAIALSYCLAATTYLLLAVKTLGVVPTLLVQVSSGLVNRLLPAGLGGLGLNVMYLKYAGHQLPVATAIVAVNNMLGFAGNVILLVLTLTAYETTISLVGIPEISWPVAAAITAVALGVSVYIHSRHDISRYLIKSFRQVKGYIQVFLGRPARTCFALLSSSLLTALHVTALMLVMASIGIPPEWSTALLAVSAGALLGAIVPTPGGLGAAEAGIAAGLAAASLSIESAVVVALIYRGITYWMPLFPGYLAFRVVERRYL